MSEHESMSERIRAGAARRRAREHDQTLDREVPNADAVAETEMSAAPLTTTEGALLYLRQQVLEAGGFTPDLLAQTIETLKEALKATRRRRIVENGIVRYLDEPDWSTRLRASEALQALLPKEPTASAPTDVANAADILASFSPFLGADPTSEGAA